MESRKVRHRQLKPWARKAKEKFEKFGEIVLMAFMGIGTAVLLAQFFGVMIGAIDPRPGGGEEHGCKRHQES